MIPMMTFNYMNPLSDSLTFHSLVAGPKKSQIPLGMEMRVSLTLMVGEAPMAMLRKTKMKSSFPCIRMAHYTLRRRIHLRSFGVTTSSPGDGIGPEASRLRLSHWAGPSVTGSAKLSQSFYGGIIIVILTKGKPVPLVWEFIYKLGESQE